MDLSLIDLLEIPSAILNRDGCIIASNEEFSDVVNSSPSLFESMETDIIFSSDEKCKSVDGENETVIYKLCGDGNVLCQIIDKQDKQNVEREKELRIQAEDHIHDQYVYMLRISHEMRNHLNTVIGFADLSAMMNSIQEIKDNLVMMKDGATKLLNIVDSSFYTRNEKLEHLTYEYEIANIKDMIQCCVNSVITFLEDKEINIHLTDREMEQMIKVDRHRFTQVVVILLQNAIKYCDKGGSIFIDCEQEGVRVNISIANTGRGMEQERLDDLLHRNDMNYYNNIGISLSAAKSIITTMGGKINANSEVGEGTCFTLSFKRLSDFDRINPRGHSIELKKLKDGTHSLYDLRSSGTSSERLSETESTQNADDTKSNSSTDGRKKILYIEDSEMNYNLVNTIVETGFPDVDLVWAPNGQTGMKMLSDFTPNLILLDRTLPDYSGDEILRYVRSNRDFDNVKVIVLSGVVNKYQINKILTMGANEYLTKPFKVDRLQEIIRKHVK